MPYCYSEHTSSLFINFFCRSLPPMQLEVLSSICHIKAICSPKLMPFSKYLWLRFVLFTSILAIQVGFHVGSFLQIPNPWCLVTVLVILAKSVADVSEILTCLLGCRAKCRAEELMDCLYCIASFLLVFKKYYPTDIWTRCLAFYWGVRLLIFFIHYLSPWHCIVIRLQVFLQCQRTVGGFNLMIEDSALVNGAIGGSLASQPSRWWRYSIR